MFKKLYKRDCLSAFLRFYGPGELFKKQCNRVEQKFCVEFRTFKEWIRDTEEASSATLHANACHRSGIVWKTIKSKKTCFTCLVRAPQHVISCGHTVCDCCVKIFGKGVLGVEYKFSLSECVLCRDGSLTALLKPPTCGVRTLGIDGGGARGIVPLEYLNLLQETLGTECVLAEFFDYAVGTSAGTNLSIEYGFVVLTCEGGLIILSMFLRGWDIQKCRESFDTIVKAFFSSKQQRSTSTTLVRMRQLVKGCINDGIYSAQDLEDCLRSVYGLQGLFSTPTSGCSGQKVAVIATAMKSGHAQVFTNYNATTKGDGKIDSYGSGYI